MGAVDSSFDRSLLGFTLAFDLDLERFIVEDLDLALIVRAL